VGVALDRPLKLPDWEEVYRANSNFGRLQVFDRADGTLRYYLNDFLTQNSYDPGTKHSLALFTYMLHELARGYRTNIEDVLCIGLGVGIVPMQFAREGVRVQVVEINPAVVPLAQKFFGLETQRLQLTLDDGRHFVNRGTNHYDAIVLDAFLGDSSPSHLMSREALAAMHRLLKPDGVLVINSFGSTEPGKSYFAASLAKTLQAVFRNVRIHGSGNGNMFYAASDQTAMELNPPPRQTELPESLRASLLTAWNSRLAFDARDGRVLTDDYNPVDYYDAATREGTRRGMATSMRRR
jgi:spermidine synthase